MKAEQRRRRRAVLDMQDFTDFIAECDRLAKKHGKRFRPSRWLRERAARGERFQGGSATRAA